MRERLLQYADLHIHTMPETPFAGIKLDGLILYAKRCGLNALAATEHNFIYPDIIRYLSDQGNELGIQVIAGAEITCQAEGHTPYLLALGIDINNTIEIPVGRTLREVAEWIKEQKAVAIVAHPTKTGNKVSLSYREVEEMAEKGLIQGVETLTLLGGPDPELNSIALKYNLARLGSSDAHSLKWIGRARTTYPENMGIIQAVRDNQVEPLSYRQYPRVVRFTLGLIRDKILYPSL